MSMLSGHNVIEAYQRIEGFLTPTPLVQKKSISEKLQSEVYFKCEGFHVVGAFKIRGALNFLLNKKPDKSMPLIAYSSGNHAQAVAWAGSRLSYKVKIFMPQNSSPLKIAGTRHWGAQVILTPTRQEAEDRCLLMQDKGATLLPPYNDKDVICGQGTALYETRIYNQLEPDLVAIPLGGGGLMSGTYLAKNATCDIVAGEPRLANDGLRSLQSGSLFRFNDSPDTIADGARTLSLCPLTFLYLKKINALYDFSESEIISATQYLTHQLRILVEPTSALAFLALQEQLKRKTYKKALVILSGANIDPSTHAKLWERNYL